MATSAPLGQVEFACSTLFSRDAGVWSLVAQLVARLDCGIGSNSDPSHIDRVSRDYPADMCLFKGDRVITSFSVQAIPEILFPLDRGRWRPSSRRAGFGGGIVFDGDLDRLVKGLRAYGVEVDA